MEFIQRMDVLSCLVLSCPVFSYSKVHKYTNKESRFAAGAAVGDGLGSRPV